MEFSMYDIRDLGSDREQNIVLTHAYGFARKEQALRYYESADFLSDAGIPARGEALAPLIRRNVSYVPMTSADFGGKWRAQGIMDASNLFMAGKPQWHMVRAASTAKPTGAYNVMLMVEGPRRYYQHCAQTTKNPPWFCRVAQGSRDCYAVWSRENGERFGSAPSGDGTRIWCARSGRGVIYWRVARFEKDGKIAGFQTRVIQIEFKLRDRDPAKDDQVVLEQRLYLRNSFTPEETVAINPDDFESSWRELVELAQAGYARSCRPIPREVDEWRIFFIDQREKDKADRLLPPALSFRERVGSDGWEGALERVKEAWQLSVVIEQYAYRDEFAQDPNYPGPLADRFGRMLAKHHASPERKAELDKMASDYCGPVNPLWRYVGQ